MADPTASIQRDHRDRRAASCPTTIDSQLESTTVIDRLTMPDTFTLVFRDPDREHPGQGADLQIGTKVKISTTSTQRGRARRS